jgi:hypothetical protein
VRERQGSIFPSNRLTRLDMRENSFVSVCVSFQTLEGSLSTRLLYAKERTQNVGRFLDRKSVFLLVTQVAESFSFLPP